MNDIVIIGMVPPCPRCGLLTNVMTQLVQALGIDAEVRHIDFNTEEAKALASSFGRVPGTAHDVEAITGRKIDWQARGPITAADRQRIADLPPQLRQYVDQFKIVAQLDNLLRPLSDAAPSAGIMMTPVLIINGELKHQGELPPLQDIERWLTTLI
jgi:hypothetical protein